MNAAHSLRSLCLLLCCGLVLAVAGAAAAGGTAYGNSLTFLPPIGGCPTPVTWEVKLAEVDDNATPPEYADDPPSRDLDAKTVKVYKHYLDMDGANVGVLNHHTTECNPPPSQPCKGRVNPIGACLGAANHAYSGTSGNAEPSQGTSPELIFEADPTVGGWTSGTPTSSYPHGAVMKYTGLVTHWVTCTGEGDATWEFNGNSIMVLPDGTPVGCFGMSSVSEAVAGTIGNTRKVQKIHYFPPRN